MFIPLCKHVKVSQIRVLLGAQRIRGDWEGVSGDPESEDHVYGRFPK